LDGKAASNGKPTFEKKMKEEQEKSQEAHWKELFEKAAGEVLQLRNVVTWSDLGDDRILKELTAAGCCAASTLNCGIISSQETVAVAAWPRERDQTFVLHVCFEW